MVIRGFSLDTITHLMAYFRHRTVIASCRLKVEVMTDEDSVGFSDSSCFSSVLLGPYVL